ncbi:DNA methyltransferase [Actinocrispum sp. NPDC049592]|uniref:Eco57I restriction-modification methylase domain-containing protein n=1 Tax=Actinocrispum sp. NPDC049592 TaxID=3154835 RepID=UPI0034227A1B
MNSQSIGRGRRRSHAPDSAEQHRDWLNLIEVSGPFLSMPVLRNAWPALDALENKPALRSAHANWLADPVSGQRLWVEYVLGDLLGWTSGPEPALVWNDISDLDALSMDVAEHDARVVPDFALVRPGEDAKPGTTELLGLLCPPGSSPTARISGESWAATPADRLARLCRHHEVELGLATDGRWWTMVWAPRSKVTTTATFDAVSWPEKAEEYVVRAFLSLLRRERFFGVPDNEKLVNLLKDSEDSQEEITEALGVQVRQAVELLVAAIGRADTTLQARGEPGLSYEDAHDVYRGAVSVMMRIVFALFAEERGLLPADNELYTNSYSAGRLCALLEQQVREGSEDDLEHSSQYWNRLLALFDAVYCGVEHPRLTMHPHDGSLFDPMRFPWLPSTIDDRTVLHMLRAVQYVEIGSGKSKERRKLSFRELDVEQIGYVYEGLLSYDGFRADEVVVGLIGKAGEEKEVNLRELEGFTARCADVPTLAKAIAEAYKDHKIGSAKGLERALKPLAGNDKEEARRKLLAACGGDATLTDRLLSFYGVIRQDLRELPVVIMPGQLYVTDSPLRKNTGTHYTPRDLAEEVVEGALEPVVYEPGPLQTADKSQWKLKSSKDILSLKVADIAMGSAAFLVAASRYLGGKLIEAWTEEGDPRASEYTSAEPPGDTDVDPVVIEARRQIIEHCLYGADINEMAVEMAKLSLWLVSMDPNRPFTFLDDRLVTGDSLLGITSLDQLAYLHLDPKKGREIHEATLFDETDKIRALLSEVANLRRGLADIDGSTLDGLARKRKLLDRSGHMTARARVFADLVVGAALAHASRGERGLRDGSILAADYAKRLSIVEAEVHEKVREWLDSDLPVGAFRRETLHWPLVFPEVFEQGGFDAVIGNPPFLGGSKISGSSGSSYREYLMQAIARGVKGNADLIAYFAIRVHNLISSHGQSGIIATNTLAQGDTRMVALDQLVSAGITIRLAIKSKPWPSRSATLEFCVICASRSVVSIDSAKYLDGQRVSGITSSLDPVSRTTGTPHQLRASKGIAIYGTYVLGMGFTMKPSQAQDMIQRDSRNREVLFPYLNGEDANSSPRCSASRWIINFHDWPMCRAQEYSDCFDHVVRFVKPERSQNNNEQVRRNWWQYKRPTVDLYRSIAGLTRVIVLTLISKTMMPVMVSTGQVFAHKLAVFATDDTAMLALLSSAPHYWWTVRRSSTMKTDINYSPSDVFETFAMPELNRELRELGDALDKFRRDVMLSRDSGLTKTYNLVFEPDCRDTDIEELRRIHREIDEATIRAYHWENRIEKVGGLNHGFHKVGRETRYTIGPAAQQEILDSLLELNHESYAKELTKGLHDKKRRKATEEGTLF